MHNITAAIQSVPLETYGGLLTLARPENAPEGASPRNYDMDYLVGSAQTRAPLENVYSYGAVSSGPNGGDSAVDVDSSGIPWATPGNILADDGTYTQCVPGSGSDALQVTAFAFDLPATVTPTGITVAVKGWATSAVTLQVQLLLGGVPVGVAKPVQLPMSNDTVMLGAAGDLWGAAVAFSDVNGVGFGVQITASSAFPGAQALLDYVTLQIGQTTANANFNFITTFVAQDGSVKNLSLDANGNFWVEGVTNNPGVLTLAFDGVTPNSFASGINGPGVEYLAFNDLTTGSDIPRQYTPHWTDRISQVGPGASPNFAPSSNAQGPPADITAYSVTSNIVTLTAANIFTAGQVVQFAGLTSATFLNGQTLLVLGSGLTGSQFQVAFTTGDVSSTADTGTATPISNYPISTITQPAIQLNTGCFYLQSTGPGSQTPGNVVTVYYQGTIGIQDTDLVNAFNAGKPVYVYLSGSRSNDPGGPTDIGPITGLVTAVGAGYPPNQGVDFYYFTFVIENQPIQYMPVQNCFLSYRRTLATLTTAVPVPGLQVGSTASIADTSVTEYNSNWPIAESLNSGTMAITQTSLTAGTALYSYSVASGANPVAGQLVTISNTLNANGSLNGVDLVIDTVSGTSAGTFTVTGFQAVTNYPAEVEVGQASTAGTQFTFDPGFATLGTANNASFGNSTGGFLIFSSNGQFIGAGTRQGVVFFITRNGYYTAPGPPVTFTVPENTTAIVASQIPIGPPNVIARGIAFTEAGANGVPGANFFTIPNPVSYIVENVNFTATSLIINDNTTTTTSFFFTDSVLLNAEAIDIQGNNLFNLIEIGNPGWIVSYASRNFYGLCQNKIQNFTNASFDGGYLPGTQLTPLGWSVPDIYGSLLVSPVFGNSYYIRNTSGGVLAQAGLIAQTAYQDAYLVPILNANTAYSVRVTARCPSGNITGSLTVDLNGSGISYGSFTVPFASLSTTLATFTGTLLTSPFTTVPTALQLRLFAAGIAANADVEIDRVEIFPTAIPVLSTTVFGSYAGDLESVDGVTGPMVFTSENTQPVNGAVVMYDTFYALKQSSQYSVQASANLEPAQWTINEVAQRAGACGVNAYDFGEQWIVEACRNGLFLFSGGQPGKIMQEIYQIWDAINWNAAKCIWVRNDVTARRLYVGVPLPTPNFWLPDAPANAAPTSPNVMLMLNYQGCETGDAIKMEMQLHTTMFGSLNATDMKRKWSIWQIPCPYAAAVSTTGNVSGEKNVLDAEVRFCNGIASSKVYRLNSELPDDVIPTDDGVPIHSLYTTYGFTNQSKSAQMPLLGVFRKLWTYMTHQVSGVGPRLNLRLLPNTLLGPNDSTTGYYPWTLPGGFPLTDPCTQIHEAPLNFAGTRTFVEFSTTGRMDISNLVMSGRKHPHNELTGQR